MYVYFIVTDGCKPRMLKIGKAKDVEARLTDIQCACPYELKLLGKLKCESEKHAFHIEGNLHRAFVYFRRRREWFLYTLEVKYAVNSILAAGVTGSVSDFKSHIFVARNTRRAEERQIERQRRKAGTPLSEATIDYNAQLDREFRAVMG